MRELNILFTCAGRRVALLEAFRRATEEANVSGKLIAADLTSASSAFHKADVGVLSPPVGQVEYVPAILEIVRKYDVGLLVPLTDLDLRSLARQKKKFADVGCQVMIGSEDPVSMCRDKARLNAILDKAGLETIHTYALDKFRTKPFYPCFIKPVRGSAGVGTGIISNARELEGHVAAYGEQMIVQEYVPGQEFTIDVYRSRDGVVRSVVPRQRLVVRSGEVEKAITVKDESLMQAAAKLAGLLGDIWGVFCCQCRRKNETAEPRFFEVNPRFAGGIPLSIAAGANFPLYLIQEVLGEPVTAEVGQFTDRLLMLRYDEAVFVQAEGFKDLPGQDNPVFR